MISFVVSGSFKQMESSLKGMLKVDIQRILESHGAEGVRALRSATPLESGLAATSWGYKVSRTPTGYSLTFTNSDVENGFPVVIMLQYGHGTGSGGYVEGTDFINPAIRPIFDKIADKAWKAVISA